MNFMIITTLTIAYLLICSYWRDDDDDYYDDDDEDDDGWKLMPLKLTTPWSR